MRSAVTLMFAIARAGLCLPFGAWAADDPSQSPACSQALSRLKAAEEAASSQRVEPARAAQRKAALACLGAGALDAPKRTGELRAPTSVPPVGALVRAAPLAAPATAPASSSGGPHGVLSVTSCDASGCWASDGSRLTRSGSLLLGPKGVCSTTGSVLNCP